MPSGRLQGQNALVTGGGSGIGRAVVEQFLAAGCRVAFVGRSEVRLRTAWQEMGSPTEAVYSVCDVSDRQQVQETTSKLQSQLGSIDILVNNAGINIPDRSIVQLTGPRWQQVLRANLDSAFFCIEAVLPGMRDRRKGLIINISSVAGKRAMPLSGAAYAASKFGMSALGLCLGIEEKDYGIRSTVIYPGEVDTPILEQRPQPVTPEQRSRILQPADVAEAVLFVATLPPRASVPELIIKPTSQTYM